MRQDGCFSPPVSTIRAALNSSVASCRWRAIEVLVKRSDKAALENLKKLSESGADPATTHRAVLALIKLGERSYVDVLRAEMDRSSSLKERVALGANLASVGDISGLHYLEQSCRSADDELRKDCARAVSPFLWAASPGGADFRALLTILLDLAEGSNASLRHDALISLNGAGAWASLPESALVRLRKIAVSSQDPEARRSAQLTLDLQNTGGPKPYSTARASLLGAFGDKKAIPELKALYEDDPDPRVRIKVAISLVQLGEGSYLEFLREAVAQMPEEQRLDYAGQLALLGDASGFRYFEAACRSPGAILRRLCAAALANFSLLAEKDEQLLVGLLSQTLTLAGDADPEVRAFAAGELEMYSGEWALAESVVVRLEKLAADSPFLEVRKAARAAVEEQRRKKQSPRKPEL